MANFTRFLNGDWVVRTSELQQKGDIDKCQWFCVMHVEPSRKGQSDKDIIYVEGYNDDDIEPVHLYSYAEDFAPAGPSEKDRFDKEKTRKSLLCDMIATSEMDFEDKQGFLEIFEEQAEGRERFLNGDDNFDSTGYMRMNATEMAVCA